MGGNFDMRVVEGKTIDEIKKKWAMMVEESQYENGNSYSGSIGMLGDGFDLHDKTFNTEEEADDYISDVQNKWEGAIAVYLKTDKKGVIVLAIGGWCSS